MPIPLARSAAVLAAVATLGLGASELAAANGTTSGSRLDDGKQHLSQAGITERQAIIAARQAASGELNEVDLEYYTGRLVWNVDVGSKNVKVDARTAKVLDANHGD